MSEGFRLSEAAMKRMREEIARFPDRRAGLLPALWVIQDEHGYIPPEGMELVAGEIGLSPAQVYEVVTFYTMFHRSKPGEYVIQVCRTLSCELMGARRILDHLEAKLGIGEGETTPDGTFTLQAVECLAACGRAPAMQVNDAFFEDVTEASVDELLEGCRKGTVAWPDEDRKGVPGWPVHRS